MLTVMSKLKLQPLRDAPLNIAPKAESTDAHAVDRWTEGRFCSGMEICVLLAVVDGTACEMLTGISRKGLLAPVPAAVTVELEVQVKMSDMTSRFCSFGVA